MNGKSRLSRLSWAVAGLAVALVCAQPEAGRADTVASLLGNFTINQFCGLTLAGDSLSLHYVVVFGQLPALRELHNADTNGDGVTSQAERDQYAEQLAAGLAEGLDLKADGVTVPLQATHWTSSLPTEQGGFSLRLDVDFAAPLAAAAGKPHQLQFANRNYAGRMGWHEIVVQAATGVAVFDTNAFSTSLTGGLSEALQSLPAAGPLDERSVHLRFVAGNPPADAVPLAARPGSGALVVRAAVTAPPESAASAPWGAATAPAESAASTRRAAVTAPPESAASAVRAAVTAPPESAASAVPAAVTAPSASIDDAASMWISRATRRIVDSISGPRLEPRIAILALLGALVLGAVHALSPGHGKTIVGAYLIGSRGTPRHAMFLGLTVTITHTLGVFVLGFATLYASRFIVPERLFPILSLISAVLVLSMGILLLVQRSRAARQALADPATAPAGVFYPVATAASEPVMGRRLLLAQMPRGRFGHTHYHAGHSHDGTMHSHGGGAMHHHDHAGHVHGGAMHSHGGGAMHHHDHAGHSHGGAMHSHGGGAMLHHHDHAGHSHGGTMHSHGGGAMHHHLPPGAAGEKITWRSLVTLGVSGGLVPCPSAMVLLLAAVALNKTAYGMLLVVAFSAGLAVTLTAVGMAFLYARDRFRKPAAGARWPHLLPVLSAALITILGIGLCFTALKSFSS